MEQNRVVQTVGKTSCIPLVYDINIGLTDNGGNLRSFTVRSGKTYRFVAIGYSGKGKPE